MAHLADALRKISIDIEPLQIDPTSLIFHFIINNTDKSINPVRIANLFRQVLMSRIPTWAIDVVEIESNHPNIHDEILCHRLALLPLTEVGPINDEEEIILTMDINSTDRDTEVTSSYLKSSSRQIIPRPNVSLAYLHKGQQMQFRAIAKRGVGLTHIKWCTVTIVVFSQVDTDNRYKFTVETDGKLDPHRILELGKQQLEELLSNGKLSVK